MSTQGGSAAKGGEDEALERLSSALIEKFAKMIQENDVDEVEKNGKDQ